MGPHGPQGPPWMVSRWLRDGAWMNGRYFRDGIFMVSRVFFLTCLNILLFLLVRYNSDVMVLLDNLLFSLFSLACGYQMSVHHNWYVKILNDWANIERTDQNNLNTTVQRPIQKVIAFKRLLNIFFISIFSTLFTTNIDKTCISK